MLLTVDGLPNAVGKQLSIGRKGRLADDDDDDRLYGKLKSYLI